MISENITVTNRLGIHARPAAMLAQTASRFMCDIKIAKDGVEVNAKSVMGVMMLAAPKGSVLKITTKGADETEAMEELKQLFARGFDED